MEFRILGPTEVVDTGRVVTLGGPKPRAVLASLLLEVNRVVSVDRLIASVWGDEPPPSAVNALQTYVSRLRRVLGVERLQRHPAGYLLAADAELIDARRFERLLAAGRAALAGGDAHRGYRAIEDAIALWRGPALLDVCDADFAQAEIARLTELRLVAAEARVEALLALGRTDESVAAARALVAEHPLRTRGIGHLMLALYRAGRQSEALTTYHEVRRLFVDEFGLDPDEDLAALAQAILRQEPHLLGAPATPLMPGVAVSAAPGAVSTADRPTPVKARIVLPPDRFIGRDRELSEIQALLDVHRLVTLTGPGGSGKTRLAKEVCRRLDQPIHVVELAGLTEPGLLEATLAEAFGLAMLADLDAVAATVGDNPVLLLLDNCEHLTEPLAGIALRLLTDLPGLRILATSRRALSIGGERRYPVPPLPVDSSAIELFLDRAAGVAPDWTCTDAERTTIAKICARLDGLPLAVELAASQMATLSPAQILNQVDQPLTIGTTRIDLPDRHRSLESTIDSSYRLLDGPQRALFARLSVFADGFDLDAADAVAGEPGQDMLTPLTALITSSMLAAVPDTSPRRYRMLETLRQYADRLLTPNDRQTVRHRHLDWISGLAATADRELRGPDARHWYHKLHTEQANTRAALGFALTGAAPTTGLRLAADLAWFWYRRGHIQEGIRWLRDALDAAPTATPDDRARALTGLASLHYLAGELPAAGETIGTAIELATAGGEPVTCARAHIYQTFYLAFARRFDEATVAGERALAHARRAGMDSLVSEALTALGHVARGRGDLAAAAANLDEAIRIAALAGFEWSVGSARWARAKVAVDAGTFHEAYEMARTATSEHDDVTSWLACLHLLAGTLGMTGRAADGAVLLGAVEALGSQVGYFPDRMDPFDSPRNVAAVRSRLSPAEYAEAHAVGRRMNRDEVGEFVRRLPGPAGR